MRNSIYRITLDMHDVASQVQITAKQHDTARKLHITLSENGSPYTIEEGCRAVLSINRTGSTVIIDDCEIKLNGSVIMYDFNSQTTEVLGINECEVKLYDPDGDIITSPRFTLLVDENVYNDGEDHGIDHRNVLNRDKEDQHPIKAITGLEKELESKANAEKIYAEIALDRSRIDNIAALGQNSVIEVQKKYNTTGATTPLTFSLNNDGKCVVIIYYYKSAPNTETYSSSVLVNSQSIFTKTLDGAAGTYLEEVEFDGKAGDIVTITRDNVNVSINSVLYVTNKSTDTELADIRLGADGTIYPCAGDAVREQVSALKNDVDSQVGALKSDLGYVKNATVTEKYSTNLYNEANAEAGYRCTGDGKTTTAENSVLSEFIEIPDGAIYAVPSAYYNGRYRVLCYSYGFADERKKPISGSGGNQTSAISIPDGAKYFRCSWKINETSQRFIGFNTDGFLIPYEEYYEPIVSIKTAEDVTKKLNDYESRISDLENSIIGSEIKRVICWGDSLTAGSGASNINHRYPFVLKSLINANNTGIVTDSAGQGGEGTYSIATRQGGVVVNIKPCTIPASGSVNVEIDKWNGLTIPLCRSGGKDVTTDDAKMKINPCYIAGVKGTLLRDSNSNYVFTRTEDGEEVTFTRPMPLLTYAHENYNGENEVAIIWSGTNDIAENGGTIEKTIQGINMMIARLKSNKYIVVGLTSKAYHPDIDDKNFRMATEYKDHFVNVRDYILAYGLEDSGITATEQDLTDIENGEIPTSLRVDNVHGNDYFYDIVAKQVYKKGQELGYWN